MTYLAIGAPDEVVINIEDVVFARVLEAAEAKGLKGDYETVVFFRSGRSLRLYLPYTTFLLHFARTAVMDSGRDPADVQERMLEVLSLEGGAVILP